jgi:hypothetical protein
MALEQLNLDDRRYADLVEEARRLIVAYDPNWTNHNPSDPGVTLIELFAFLTETLLYRLDQVTEANQRKFLKLLRGPSWTPSGPTSEHLAADTRATVQRLRARYRAVTADDYEYIALQDFNSWLHDAQLEESSGGALEDWWATTRADRTVPANLPSHVPSIGRVLCLAERNLDAGSEPLRAAPAPAHVSVVVLAAREAAPDPPAPLLSALWGFLDERRMLTTRHHVVAPTFAPVGAEIVVARTSDAVEEDRPAGRGLRSRIVTKLEKFLHPLKGGELEQGWPFGRDVFVSEFYRELEDVPGVDYVSDLMLSSRCDAGDERCVPASPIWHSEGDLIGLRLEGHHLPRAQIDPLAIVIAPHTSFVRVGVSVTLEAALGPLARRAQPSKAAIRRFFHPLSAAPTPVPPAALDQGSAFLLEFRLDALRQALRAALGLPATTSIGLALDADERRLRREGGVVVSLGVNSGEIVNWRARIALASA